MLVFKFSSHSIDDLAQNWSQLTLSKREGPSCCLTHEDSSSDFYMVAKFLMKRARKVDVVARTFTPL